MQSIAAIVVRSGPRPLQFSSWSGPSPCRIYTIWLYNRSSELVFVDSCASYGIYVAGNAMHVCAVGSVLMFALMSERLVQKAWGLRGKGAVWGVVGGGWKVEGKSVPAPARGPAPQGPGSGRVPSPPGDSGVPGAGGMILERRISFARHSAARCRGATGGRRGPPKAAQIRYTKGPVSRGNSVAILDQVHICKIALIVGSVCRHAVQILRDGLLR